ncbi:MAG: tripartite tricarboxylate transporter substrate binding protein [Bradyrhizobiaceae bacterium]|nr:tripartite tricarboxylate transporter substrate binding protein [Bradyrhizobiaceae bacterium]
MIRVLALVLLMAGFSSAALAQTYPNHPVHVYVGYAAGSGPDIQARTVSQALSAALGQSFVVENRTGANGTLAARAVVQAAPDGYTLLFSSASISPTPFVYKNLGYDLLTDLAPVATVGELDGVFMLVNGGSPIMSVPEFIAHARDNRVMYGSPGVGNELHLKAELFGQQAGIKMQHVPYRGSSEVLTGLLSGAVEMMFVTPPAVMGLLGEGRVRALAFTGSKPFPQFPDVPLMKQYLPNYVQGSWGMFFAPARTPDAVVGRLNDAIHAALLQPAVAAVMQRDGYMPDTRNSAETAAFFRRKVEEAEELVKAAGIEPN